MPNFNDLMACCNDKHPSKWVMFIARLFGKKFVGCDGDHIATMHAYRGQLYLISFRKFKG